MDYNTKCQQQFNNVYKYIIESDDKNNGTKIILIPMTSKIFSAGIFINAGSKNETEAFGIAHFLEHMTFKGTKTKNANDINNILDKLGANYNASTSIEYTSYYLSGDSVDQNELLDILFDLYSNPNYPIEEIENEKNVVLEEWRMNQDNNTKILFQKINSIMMKCADYSLQRPTIGFKENILKYNRNDILNFREKNYIGHKTSILIAGNFNLVDILLFIKKYFISSIKPIKINKDTDSKDNDFVIPFKDYISDTRFIFIEKNIEQSVIILSFRAPNISNVHINYLNILSEILTSGFTSRLFNLLRNKLGVSYYCSSEYYGIKEYGTFNIRVGLDPNVILNTIKELLKELFNIASNGVSEDELKIAKKKCEVSLLFSFKEPSEYVNYYGLNEINNLPYRDINDIYNVIKNTTIDNVNNVAKNIINKNNMYIGIIGKNKKNEDIRKYIDDIIN